HTLNYPTSLHDALPIFGKEINNQLSNQFSNQTANAGLKQIKIPEKQVHGLINQINNSYSGDISHVNQMSLNMNYKMLLMFLTLAVYIGAMIGAMELVSAFKENRHKTSNIRLFVYFQLTAIIIVFAVTLITLLIKYLVNN